MIVLDASALVDVVIDQSSAPWVLDQIAEEEVAAPAHQPAEILSALARLVRAAILDPGAARDALDEAFALPQRLIPASPAHARRAFALRDRVRVIDGLYVVLADELGCPLVSTDRRLAGAEVPCEIRVPPGEAIPGPRGR